MTKDKGNGWPPQLSPGSTHVVEAVGQGGHGQAGVSVDVVGHMVQGLGSENKRFALDLVKYACC